MKKGIVVLFVLFFTMVSGKAQSVSPLQAGHYMPGIIDVRDYTNPPPGLFVALYNVYMSADTYIDRNGNKLKNIDLSKIDPSLPNINLNMDLACFASVPVLAWASSWKVLGATYVPYVMLPAYTYADGSIFTEMAFGTIDSTVSAKASGNASGWGDMFIQPIGLSWALNGFDLMLSYGFYTPNGRYTTGASDNIGLGYWTHQFEGFAYYYPVKDQSTALMLGLTYEINSSVVDADVTPGSRLSLEWGVSQYFTERFELSVQGADNWQVGNDRGTDVWWDGSVHDEKHSIFFSANYWAVKERLYLALKYGFDYSMRQRFDNNTLALNLIWVTNALTGK